MKRWLMALSLAVIPAARGHSAAVPSDDPRIREALTLAEVWLDAEMAYEAIPGLSAAIVHDQEMLWTRGFGYADVEQQDAGPPRHALQCLLDLEAVHEHRGMQLRDEGQLELDEPIGKYLPWFNIKQVYPESAAGHARRHPDALGWPAARGRLRVLDRPRAPVPHA